MTQPVKPIKKKYTIIHTVQEDAGIFYRTHRIMVDDLKSYIKKHHLFPVEVYDGWPEPSNDWHKE